MDWLTFLWDTESAYWIGMYHFLKEDLKMKCPEVGTAAGYSPALMQAQLDVVDAHAYWHPPTFPGKAWDISDWYVVNQTMAGASDGGCITGLAGYRAVVEIGIGCSTLWYEIEVK